MFCCVKYGIETSGNAASEAAATNFFNLNVGAAPLKDFVKTR